MYRPFIFCQMMITVDGKINGEFFNDPAYPPAIPVFRECFCTEGETRYPCQAGVFGKNTIQQNYTGYDMPALDENAPLVPEGDFWPNAGPAENALWWISVSNSGNLNWQGNTIEYAGRTFPVLEVITSNASNAYKAYLRKLNIPYLICGDDKRIDPKILCTKLKDAGIDCLALGGGGMINWDWIKRGLCDELSLTICPVGEGNSEEPSLFSTGGKNISETESFKLKNVEVHEGGVVYLQYECPNSDLGYK